MFRKRTNTYYTLVASLPPLPRFDVAQRMPINRVRLGERLTMLKPEDLQVVEQAEAFFSWRNQPAHITDREMVENYAHLEALSRDSSFGALFAFFSDLKTVTVALRRRHLGRPQPTADEHWGVGQWGGHIQRNWSDPNFKLTLIYPWVPQVREHIEQGKALEMERVLFGVEWDFIDRCAQGKEFSFEAVMTYLCKWDILDRWLSYNKEEAGVRFQELLSEVTNEQEGLFD